VTNVVTGTHEYVYAYELTGIRNGEATAYTTNPLNQYTAISNPAYDLNGHQKSAKPKAEPPGDRDFEAARARGARSRIRRHSGNCHRMTSACSNGVLLVSNVYDHQSRRIRKEVYAWDSQSTAYSLQSTAAFLWDDWNVIREVRGQSSAVSTNYYTWGVDLSGSQQGVPLRQGYGGQAGGVGGLLAVTTVNQATATFTSYYPLYDANGNVTGYLDADGATAATFEYDAFGNVISEDVSPGLHLPFRFSTKYADAETGLYYYGYRFYEPELVRFLNRDPIEERGGLSLYGFVGNDPLDRWDYLGMMGWRGPASEDGFHDEDGKHRNDIKCCGTSRYNPSSECCENKRAVAKMSIWVCRRKLLGPDSYWPKIGPLSHTFIVCEDPNINPYTELKFGKQPRPNNQDCPFFGPGCVEKEKWKEFGDCTEQKVCPTDKSRMCKESPTSWPYFLFSPWHNCHGWGNCRSK
jgi:RHS repeat-associated protein